MMSYYKQAAQRFRTNKKGVHDNTSLQIACKGASHEHLRSAFGLLYHSAGFMSIYFIFFGNIALFLSSHEQ